MNSNDPFAPPKSDVSIKHDAIPGSPVKAVLLGFLADFGGSIVGGIPLGVIYGVLLAMSGVPQDKISGTLNSMPPDSLYSIIGFCIGFAFSILGGYVCARIAKQNEYFLAGAMATLSAICGSFITPEDYSVGTTASLTVLSYAFVFFGANLGRKKNRSA